MTSDQPRYHSQFLAPTGSSTSTSTSVGVGVGVGAGSYISSGYTSGVPVTKQPEETNQASRELGSSKSVNKSNDEGLIIIDLTQDDVPSTTTDTANGKIATSSKAAAKHLNTAWWVNTSTSSPGKRQNDTTESTVCMAGEAHIKSPSPSPSDTSSDLPSTSRICEMLVRDSPCTPNNKHGHSNFKDAIKAVHRSPVTLPVDALAKPMAGQKVVDDVFVPEPRASGMDKITTFSPNTHYHEKHKSRPFDTSAFDMAIYQQPGAQRPPRGVAVPRRRQHATYSEDERQYIHANPAIHRIHNRPKVWYARKALEIQARGGRKFWFGKVAKRVQWLRRQHTEPSKEQEVNSHVLTERSDPEPQTYTRPLDFGDVPESKLPEDVRENADWLKACEWFRQQQGLKEVRLRESKRCEQEANEYYKIISQGGIPDMGSGIGD